MGASLFFLLSAALFSLGNANPDVFQCSRYCKGDSKFGYEIGSSYKYQYNGEVKNMVNSTTIHGINAQSRLLFVTEVQISVLSTCDYVMKLSNAAFVETYRNKGASVIHTPEQSSAFEAALSEKLLYFSFQNGRIEAICPDEEDQGILHIKKGILSAFQNSMPNLEGNAVVYETDISGNCETQYQIKDFTSELVIKKVKNLNACAHRRARHLSWLSVPYSKNSDKNSESLLRSKQVCIQRFDKNLILESSRCSEEHLFQPFSNGDNGAVTYLNQHLEFLEKLDTLPTLPLPKNFHYETLLSNYKSKENNETNQIEDLIGLLEKLERSTTDGVEPDVPKLFSQLVYQLQNLDHHSITAVFQFVKNSIKQRKFLLDAMPLLTTIDGINTMKMLFAEKEISEYQMNSWLGSLVFLTDVSLPTIDAIAPLMEEDNPIKQKAILSGSTLLHMYCRKDSRCLDKFEIQNVIRIIQKPLVSSCIPTSPQNHNEILLSLKAIGNIGLASSLGNLKNCYSNMDSPMELRLAAIAAHRRINCAENENLEQFEDYFANVHQDTEIRIASYLATMQCASYATFSRVKDVLRNEETNQVGSFVWTHLTNLQESSSQWKQNLKGLVENEFLRNKFSTDMRKYSRNYEVSSFFDSLNTGVTMESNVIFTSESYLPKSAMLNFTLDLFGEAVNVFEIGARIEGFEQVIENLFGPEGYFPEESIRNVLESARNKENRADDKLQELRDSFTSQTISKEPSGLLYGKIFGNEISYTHFNDIEGLVGGKIDGRRILDALMKLFRQQDVDYRKSFVFLDSSYIVPTILGFPLELTVNGTATIGLTVKSKIDLKDLQAHKIGIEGKIYPSAAVEVIGTMMVDYFVSKIGLRSVSTLNSNTYLDGHAFINKGKLVDLKLNVPKQQMNIINVDSQLFVVQNNHAYPMDDVTDNVENWEGCTQKTFSTITGLEVCSGFRYVNASLSQNAPYFPLTGRFKYAMDIKKTDVFDSYQLSLKTHSEVKNYRPIYFMAFYLDTPNSLVNRKIKTSYLLDCEKLSFNATLQSPFINLEINSKIGDDFDNLGFLLETKLNNNEILFANTTLKSTKNGNTWRYEPLAELKYKNKQVAALSGYVNYLQGTKYSANLELEGISSKPVAITGDLHFGSKRFKLIASIKSDDINGNAHAIVIKKPESISVIAKTTYDYQELKEQVFDFEFKQYTTMKESVSEEGLYLSANFTQKPLYNTLLSFNVQRDKLYLETKGLATVFGTTWNIHQLFKFLRSSEKNDMALKVALTCLQKNIDYHMDLSHINSDNAFKVHGLLQLNKIQRVQVVIDYTIIPNQDRLLNLLLYYPKQTWMINGAFNKYTENTFYVFLQSFYEVEEEKKSMLVLSGQYTNSTIANFQNHTITGSIEVPESNGRFDTPWTISSSLQISPDLFLHTVQLQTQNNFYVTHLTWAHNSFAGLVQIDNKQLLVVSGMKGNEEMSMSIVLNIYQHFDMSAKLLMPYRNFQFVLYWDKDRDANQKVSLIIDRNVKKGLHIVDLEYPNQKVTASFILLPAQVTVNVTWGIDSTQRIYLKAGNRVYDIGGIWFAKLETPFKYLETQEFKLSYYTFPQNAELKIDISWRDQTINLIMSGTKSISYLSAYLDVNTTIPEISKISIAVSHNHSNANGLLKIKNDATFVFNHHQITGQCRWENQGSNISSSFEIVSSSDAIFPIIGELLINNNQTTNHLSGFIIRCNKTISVDYKFENSQSYLKIKTPFKGLEITELDYTLIGDPDKLVLELKINVLTQLHHALVSWNNDDYASIIKFEITCPIVGEYKVMLKHSTVFGYLDEHFVISQGNNNDILAVKLHGDFLPICSMDVIAAIQFLEHTASLVMKNSPDPMTSILIAKWDETYVTSSVLIEFVDNEIGTVYWNVVSSLLNEEITVKYHHGDSLYMLSAVLPAEYRFSNFLNFNGSFKSIKNALNIHTPRRTISLRYSHALDNYSFDHELIFKINNNISRLALNYNFNKDINFIDAASLNFTTAWHNPITLNFSMPHENGTNWKPSLYLEYNNEKIVSINSLIKFQYLHSDISIFFDLPHTVPFDVVATYDLRKRVKTVQIVVIEQGTLFRTTCDFYLENLEGLVSLNVRTLSAETESDVVVASFGYDISKPLKVANLNVSISEQQYKLQLEASTILDKGVRKGEVLFISTIEDWEKVFLNLLLGLTKDESYVTIGKNDKKLTTKYLFEKSLKNGCAGKISLTSNFEYIKNCSLEILYKNTEKSHNSTLVASFGKHIGLFKGNYLLTDQMSKGVQVISIDSELKSEYYRTLGSNRKNHFNIDAQLKGSMKVKKMGGKINAVFISNIPNIRTVNIDADYELYKKGYNVKAAILYNKDFYAAEHYLQPLPNKFEFSTSLQTPPRLYGNITGKISFFRHDDSIDTEILLAQNLQFYNFSMWTRYEAILTSYTIIHFITPNKEYKGGLNLTETRGNVYAIIGDEVNEAEFSIVTKYFKKGELDMRADLGSFNIAPWILHVKYDFRLPNKMLSARLNCRNGAGLEATLDNQKLHFNVDTSTTKNFLMIFGDHRLDDINDLLISYAIYFNDQKLKLELFHILGDKRTIFLELYTTFRNWRKIYFKAESDCDKFRVDVEFKGNVIAMAANKNALFSNQDILLIEFHTAFIRIWSGTDESYLTSLTQWGEQTFLIRHASNPKLYAFSALHDGNELVSLTIKDISTTKFFTFTTIITNSLFPDYSNLTAYFCASYEIPNSFSFNLDKGHVSILDLSYNFALNENQYTATFYFKSHIDALQLFTIDFKLNPQFLLNFVVSKRQYNEIQNYQLIIRLPIHSNESQLIIEFPWDTERLLVVLDMKPSYLDFIAQTPLKEWKELNLRIIKDNNSATGFFKLQKNNAYVVTNCNYGYDKGLFVKMDTKNKFGDENAEEENIVVDLRYSPEGTIVFSCDANEFGHKVHTNFRLNGDSISCLNVTLGFYQKADATLQMHYYEILNLIVFQALRSDQVWFGIMDIHVFDKLHYYNTYLTIGPENSSDPIVTASLISKTYNYFYDVHAKGQISNITNGHITATIVKGYEPSVYNYEISWLVKHITAEKIVWIGLKEKDHLTYIDLRHFSASDTLKSEITVACGSQALNLQVAGTLNSETSSANISLTTPLEELSQLKLETSLTNENGTIELHNFLAWPYQHHLSLDVSVAQITDEMAMDLLFTSSFNEPLKIDLFFITQPQEIEFSSTCVLGKDEITLSGTIIPQSYLSTVFSSPFVGYTSLNLTCSLNLPSHTAYVYFEKESLVSEFLGTVKEKDNKIYEIDMVADSTSQLTNQSFAKVLLKIDTIGMKGNAEVSWEDNDILVGVSYDPKNLLLEVKSPFAAAQEIRLQGEYFNNVDIHNLKGRGVWNKLDIGFLCELETESNNFVAKSQIHVGQLYKGLLNFSNKNNGYRREISFSTSFPDDQSVIDFIFISEKVRKGTKSSILLTTSFETISMLNAETVIEKRYIDSQIMAELMGIQVASNFKLNFKPSSHFDTYLLIRVPRMANKWAVNLKVSEHGFLNVDYVMGDFWSNATVEYQISDSKLKSHYYMNGTKANISHTLEVYFKDDYNIEYGFVLDDYRLIYKYLNELLKFETIVQANIPYIDLKSEASVAILTWINKIRATGFCNAYDFYFTMQSFESRSNGSMTINLENSTLSNVYIEIDLLQDGFFIKNNISDSSGLWLNTTVLYTNNEQELQLQGWSKHKMFKPVTVDFYISKSCDKIYAEVEEIFLLDFDSKPMSSKFHALITNRNRHELQILVNNSNFNLDVNSPLFQSDNLKLNLHWSDIDKGKELHVNYFEMDNLVLRGYLQFYYSNYSMSNEEYRLITRAYCYDKLAIDFFGKILITNVTQGYASLDVGNDTSHAYFIINPSDPYITGLTIGSPYLPYGGITLETGTSIESSSIFVFAGSGPTDVLDRGVIQLESHEKYMLFEASIEGQEVFAKYEAPAIAWLRLVDLKAKLDVQNKTICFFENFEIQSDITGNITVNSKFNVLPSGLETKLNLWTPFLAAFPKFDAELQLPFDFSNNMTAKMLIQFPNDTYSTHLRYQRQNDKFLISSGYQYNITKFNATLHLTNDPLPTVFMELNLPYGNYNYFGLSLTRPKNLTTEQEIRSYIDLFNNRFDLQYTIAYRRDRQLLKAFLTSPFELYNKFSLNLEHQNDQVRILKALLYYPTLEKECGVDFALAYRNMKEFKLNTKISLPDKIFGFMYGQFMINHNLNIKGKNKSYILDCFSKINNFNVSFDLATTLNSDLVQFGLDTRTAENRFYINAKSAGSIFDNLNFLFELETPLDMIQDMKLFLISSINLTEGIHTGIVYNSKTYLQLDFIITNGEVFFKLDNIWKPSLLKYQYSYTENFRAAGLICWDLNKPEISQFGGHVVLGKNFSVELILPTRIMSVDANYCIDDHNEYYFGRVSWYKDKEVAAELNFINFTSKDKIYIRTAAALTLPFRTFEIIDEVDANFQESPIVKSKFTFKWDKNDSSSVSLQNYVLPGKLESRLFVPVLEHKIVLKLDMSRLAKVPSRFKAQLEYSKDVEKHIEFEMYYDKEFRDIYRTERQFILKHPASKIDYCLHFSTTRTPEFTTGNISLKYTNYFLNRSEQIRSSLKIGHERFEVAGEIETSKNYLSVSGATKSGPNFQGFLMVAKLNRKDPLTIEGIYNFKPTGSSISLASSYGNSRRYDFYAGLPSKREITVKLAHEMYGTTITDGLFTIKLNTSQILWLKLHWKNQLLPQMKKTVLEEYSDLRFIIEATGQQLIDIVDDDFGQTLISDASELQKNLTAYTSKQLNLIHEDYRKFIIEIEEGYQSNAFYCKDIERIVKILFPNIDTLKTILLDPICEFFQTLYKGIFETIYDMSSYIRSICSMVQTQIEYALKEFKDIKKLKARAKEILKSSIGDARESLKKMDILIAQLMDNIDEYVTATKEQCEEFFEPYLKLLDDFVIYVEQRLAILQMVVLDMLDTVQHYILNLRESRELLKVYELYLNWLEEFHITDLLEPIGDVIESILETIITDVKSITDDYRPYLDAISEAVFGNYEQLNNLPPLTELREMLNRLYQRTLWIWNYHNLSESVKNFVHKIISDFDDYLASLIKLDDSSNDFENVLGQSDYVFRPDIGTIQITQPLPVEWEAFDEMPYFEQLPLYHKIKKRVENLIQIQRHHFSDLLNLIKSYTGESPNTLLFPSTNNIAMLVGKSHYITFDKKYYNFAGECSYLLASNFVTNAFSVVVNYKLTNSTVKKNSITITSDYNIFEIHPDFTVTINNVTVNLPLVMGSLSITRENTELLIDNSKGLKVIYNPYYDYYIVELSGWLFGKTAGLLGTLDNERITDMSMPDGDQTSDVDKFAQSWQAGIFKCKPINHANDTTNTNPSPLSTTLFETLCQIFFINANSPFGQCFSSVDPKPFYDMCVSDMKNIITPTMCTSAAAYKARCDRTRIFLEMPELCVHCKYNISFNEEKIFDRNLKQIDVVFIKENACFGNNNFSSLPVQINRALKKRSFRKNQFAVVSYGGITNKPYIHTSGKDIWTNAENTPINSNWNFSTDPKKKPFTADAVDAIESASNLQFRPGVSKLFILMQCDLQKEFTYLKNLPKMFGEKDITLHVLKAKSSQDGEELLELGNNDHVLYIQHGFNIQNSNIVSMNTTIIEGISDQITDIYSLLALSTNGTVLSIDNEITQQTNLIFSSWADIISQTAKSTPCQKCKCVANPNGTGKIECTRCLPPMVKQLLNEYESNIMEFHSDPDSEDYM